MRILNQVTYPETAGGPYAMPKSKVQFPNGRRCRSLKQKYIIPCKNTDGSSRDVSLANLLALLAIVVGTFKLSFGSKTEEIVDSSLTFDDLRLLHVLATGRDFVILNESGNPIFLKDYAGDLTITTGATVSLTCYIDRPFYWLALNDDADHWLPGATQMRQINVQGIRGSGFSTGSVLGSYFVQNGNVTIEWYTSDVSDDNDRDEWAPVFRIFKSTSPGYTQAGPEGLGAVLAIADQNAVGLSTSLQLVSVSLDGHAIHQQTKAAELIRDGILTLPVGVYDPNNLATVLYSLPEESKLEDLETGEVLELRQAALDVAYFKQFTVYVPQVSAEYVNSYVGPNATHETDGVGEFVKITGLRSIDHPNMAPHLASISPPALITQDSPHYEMLAGTLFTRGSSTGETSIPASMLTQVRAALSTQPSEEAQAAALAGVSKRLSSQLPGGTKSKRGATSTIGVAALRKVTPSGLLGLVDAAAAKGAGKR